MRNPIASNYRTLTSRLCVLLLLAGCVSEPEVVVKTVTVKVPVPVLEKLDSKLLVECVARYQYSPFHLSVRAMRERLEAVEDALAMCANQIELIRAAQDKVVE